MGVTNDNGESLAKVMTLLSETPKGDTPICKQIKEITLRVKEMEEELINNETIADLKLYRYIFIFKIPPISSQREQMSFLDE